MCVPALELGHDLAAMARAVTARTRVVFIANPNNPTGTWVNAQALEAFIAALPPHVIVALDEAYFEYTGGLPLQNGIEWLARYPNLVVFRTFSKAYGLAGVRVGYAVSHPSVADMLKPRAAGVQCFRGRPRRRRCLRSTIPPIWPPR